jgi:D-galactose 1-dehydrogenase
VQGLHELARRHGCTLFASWHSRHARAVPAAESWLGEQRVRSIRVTWKEDVRIWHPGQRWLWEHGGLGVFDPGINALSILTKILARTTFYVERASLFFPKNSATPISAHLRLASMQGAAAAEVELDFLQQGPQTWDIAIDTDGGRLLLSDGGNTLSIDGRQVEVAATGEYPNLYAHFARLLREQRCDVDVAPLQLTADAFLCGDRTEVAPFIE